MNDTQVNNRQLKILEFLLLHSEAPRKDLEQLFVKENYSKITIIRDLNQLIDLGWIKQIGGGKYVSYSLLPNKSLLIPVDAVEYFKESVDKRTLRSINFNSEVIDVFDNIFTPSELAVFEAGKQKFISQESTLDQTIFKRELERFTIEFSWKSSQIEGNTYSLLETEELIKNNRQAKGHDESEATMILNHKHTFDLILNHRQTFTKINEVDIRSIHTEMTHGLDVTPNIREHAVGITGTRYQPLDNRWQIEEALAKIITKVNQLSLIPEQSLFLLAIISYLQPFADGNKRTARMLSNAVLLANGYYPLSYRSLDEVEFKKALILFYEQNNLYNLKKIFIEQQQFAIDNYFI